MELEEFSLRNPRDLRGFTEMKHCLTFKVWKPVEWKPVARSLLLSMLSSVLVLVLSGSWAGVAWAGALSDRLAQYPNWQNKPPLQAAQNNLVYPDWFAGEWLATTTLTDLVAPLAPDVVTPGFEGNRDYLNQPVAFQVRFVPLQDGETGNPAIADHPTQWVSDRAFNGLNLARAYLDSPERKSPVLAVKVDPTNPNRQITVLRGDRQLVSTVTARATETPSPNQFLTSELFQQEFRGSAQLYFNQVETTTAYTLSTNTDTTNPEILADQITAIYLSPQDPDYFKAPEQPVALYRYHMTLSR